MKFETHLTVSALTDNLKNFAKAMNIKITTIALDKGDHSIQPMLTFYGEGTLVERFMVIEYITNKLKNTGSEIIRTKIEIPFDGNIETIPVLYYEQHAKLLIPSSEAELSKIRSLGGHLSKNALKRFDNGFEERFITQRCSANTLNVFQEFSPLLMKLENYKLLKYAFKCKISLS